VRDYALPEYDASVLCAERPLVEYFEEVVRVCQLPKSASNWIMGEVLRLLSEGHGDIRTFGVSAERLGELILAVERGEVSAKAAKGVLREMERSGQAVGETIAALGLEQISDEESLSRAVDLVLEREADRVAQYRAGRIQVLGYLVGQVMRVTSGKANPHAVNEILRARLG